MNVYICINSLLYNLLLKHRCNAFFYKHKKLELEIFPGVYIRERNGTFFTHMKFDISLQHLNQFFSLEVPEIC